MVTRLLSYLLDRLSRPAYVHVHVLLRALLLSFLLSGCVSQATHESALSQLEAARGERLALEAALSKAQASAKALAFALKVSEERARAAEAQSAERAQKREAKLAKDAVALEEQLLLLKEETEALETQIELLRAGSDSDRERVLSLEVSLSFAERETERVKRQLLEAEQSMARSAEPMHEPKMQGEIGLLAPLEH